MKAPDFGNMEALDKFHKAIADGETVGYFIADKMPKIAGFVLFEPKGEGPWIWVSGRETIGRLTERAPDAKPAALPIDGDVYRFLRQWGWI